MMKLLLPLATALILAGCKSDPPEPETPPVATEAEIRAVRAVQVKRLNRKHAIEKQLNKLVAASKIDPKGEMKIVLAEGQQALLDLQTIRTTHPSLLKLNKDLNLWRSHLQSARTTNRKLEIQQAHDQILEITAQIQTLSEELPVIREAEDRIARSRKEIDALRRTLAEKTPEGQALMKELAEIEKAFSTIQ